MPDARPALKPEDDSSMSSDLDKDIELSRIPSRSFRSFQDDELEGVTGAAFDDPNLDLDHLGDYEEDSPYPEVRSAVSNTDDPEMPASTIRAWALGMVWAILLPGVNQFFFFRYPSVTVGGLVALLVSYPIGRAWEVVVPNWRIFGQELNPGPFTMKEHVLLTIMSSIGASSAYATDIVAVQRVFYGQKWSFAYQWLIVMSTQLIGFSIGGLVRRYLVDPPSMIWPSNLVVCALFNTLHSQRYSGMGQRGGISRERFFIYAFAGSFAWYFLPGYLFTALSFFDWVTWIAPDNIIVNQLFGYQHGLGMSVLTFDWAQIAFLGSPLATPWWAEVNVISGFVLFYWFLTPILYYTNSWYSKYMPVSDRYSYDRFQNVYNVSRILSPDATLNETAYREYSPIYMPMTLAVSYGVSFASISATLVHCFIYYRRQIIIHSRRTLNEQPDIHARLMSVYRQVPNWWYAVIFVTMFIFGVVAIERWPTKLPIWAFILSLVIACSYVDPTGIIQAITNKQIGLNVITELIVGFALPGRPVALMLFKTWGYITMSQALAFASDFKLGHYMKIPPRSMFWAQVIATIIGGTVQLGVQSWMFDNIKDMCPSTPVADTGGFACPQTATFGTASVIWGVIGPKNLFTPGKMYYGLSFFFLVGALSPVVSWLWTKRYPGSWLRYVNFPVIYSGTANLPPALPLNYITWTLVGFIFQYVVRRRRFNWWAKYNYVLSAGLDSGVAVAALIIFFGLQFPTGPHDGHIAPAALRNWWGNTVYRRVRDANATLSRLEPVEPGGFFGLAEW